jgi:hypothetical protein
MSTWPNEMKLEIMRYAFEAQKDEAAQVDVIVPFDATQFDVIMPFIEELAMEENTTPESEAREIKIKLGSEGDITLATSTKLSNLRFRWKDALPEGSAKMASIAGAVLSHPALVAFLCLGFLKFVRQFATLQIKEIDAKVLMGLCVFKAEEKVIDMDAFSVFMTGSTGINGQQLDQSLGRLEQLGCISRIDGEIIMNEVIVVQKDKS